MESVSGRAFQCVRDVHSTLMPMLSGAPPAASVPSTTLPHYLELPQSMTVCVSSCPHSFLVLSLEYLWRCVCVCFSCWCLQPSNWCWNVRLGPPVTTLTLTARPTDLLRPLSAPSMVDSNTSVCSSHFLM